MTNPYTKNTATDAAINTVFILSVPPVLLFLGTCHYQLSTDTSVMKKGIYELFLPINTPILFQNLTVTYFFLFLRKYTADFQNGYFWEGTSGSEADHS